MEMGILNMLVKVSNIVYDFGDTEGYDENAIPKTLIVEVDDIDDAVDAVSDITGLCVLDSDSETISLDTFVSVILEKMNGASVTFENGLVSIPSLGIEHCSIDAAVSKMFS